MQLNNVIKIDFAYFYCQKGVPFNVLHRGLQIIGTALIPGPVSIINLINQIRGAVKIAGENEECREIMNRVEIINTRVQKVRALPAMLQDQEMKQALSGTHGIYFAKLSRPS
jgi:hypothetical protein